MGLYTSVGQRGSGSQIASLCALVLVKNSLLLGVVEHQKLGLFLDGQTLVSSSSLLDFALQDGEQRVVLVLHHALAEACEG